MRSGVLALVMFSAMAGSVLAADISTRGASAAGLDVKLVCGALPPGNESGLARLFEYAGDNRGDVARVSIDFDSANCVCPSAQEGALVLLEQVCRHNPEWALAEKMKPYACVQAVGLAGYNAGVGSVCFPAPGLFPVERGYSVEHSPERLRISGEFVTRWEWSLGAPHVQLLLPD